MNKTNSLKRLTMLGAILAAMMAALPAMAAEYVLAYVNGGTTYYLARNGTSGVQRVTTFDPTTCIWSCASNTAGTTAGTLNNSNTYGYLYQMVNGTRYFLGAPDAALALATNVPNNYYRWRTNGTYVYNRYSNNTSYYINLANGVARNTTANTASNARPYQVNTSTVDGTSTAPTISGNDVLSAANSFTYTASGAAYRIGYTNYNFNSANHYFDENGNSFSGTPAAATPSYSWSISSAANVSISGTTATGTVTVSNLPESDMPATITVTVTFTGGTPAAPANTTLTASKEIVLQGTKPSAPIISVSGNTATITTDAAGSTSIRYTLDGSNPTTSTGTVYSGAIDLAGSATSPVTIKAVTVRNGNASEVSSEVVTLTLPEPTITINGEAQTATITSSVAGATIYYTTDGSTPTTSSSQYTGALTSLAYMTTVKAIAVKDGWNDSPVASGIVTIPSGVSGGVVTLFDYEPHSWSYYSDATLPEMMRSLNPADVKITYYGDGIVMTGNTDYTAGMATSNYVLPGNANYVGGAKVNVGGEDENTFVYYKTLERTDGSTSANPTGRCAYTTIPNPFQVRPTYGSRGDTDADNFTGWRGFQCWRLKSVTGGSVYSAASGGTALATGAIINGETEIYFAPSGEYGMAVELEAVWARAYVKKGNSGGANNILSQNVGVERNFMILTAGQNYRFDGTSGRYIGNKGYAVTISNYYPSGEAPDNTNSTISGYNDMTLGADTKFENVTFNSMGSYTLTAAGYDLIIGRGCTGTVNVVRGINANVTSPNYTLRIESGTYNNVSLLRGYGANTTQGNSTDGGNNLGGTPSIKAIFGCDYDRATNNGITNNLIVTYNIYYASGVTANNTTYSENALNAYFKSGKIGNGITINNNHTAAAQYTIYMGAAANRLPGHRKVFVEGGELSSIAGGIDGEGNENKNSLTLRMTGGHVRGAIYGGGARSAGYGNRKFVITGGDIVGWVGGGCNGEAMPAGGDEDTYGGITYGSSKVYFGGTAVCGGTGSNIVINGSIGGTVFGAGKGVEGNTTSGRMSQGTTVVVADECDIERNVYGGGNFGYAQTSTAVYVAGGHVHGDIFGGSNQNNGPDIDITMRAGKIDGGLYGGSNTSGNITGHINIDVYGTDPQEGANYAVGAVYGGGNQANYSGAPNVSVHCGENISIGYVYGGGNAATVTGTNVTIEGGNKIGNVFGGCYGANVTTNGTKVNVKGGTIGKVFGGNNQSGTITGAIKVRVDKQSTCPMKIGELYGGGNVAASAVGSIDIGCTGDRTAAHSTTPEQIGHTLEGIGDVYGGANAAAVTGNVTLTIDSGMVYRVFGNNNTSASVSGTITVNIDKQNDACGWYVGHVYGGGNKAPYTAPNATPNHPAVNIKNGEVSYNVFGGGLGTTAAVTGNPQVTLSGTAEVGGNVYGGGNAAPVSGNTKVTLRD